MSVACPPQLGAQSALPVMHLRSLNPHVADALTAAAMGRVGAPRQARPLGLGLLARAAPQPHHADASREQEVAACVSAFAFQV